MELKTNHLGTIQYEKENVIHFEEGIPGFEKFKDFLIVLSNDEELPFHFLQSTEDATLSFMITSPFIFANPYDFELSQEDVDFLKIKNADDVSIYSIVTIPDKLEETTINLAAPIVVNNAINQAKQVVIEEIPILKYKIFGQDGKGDDA